MKYCQRCGYGLMDEAGQCPYCGTVCPPMEKSDDKKSFLWGALCFFFPLVGLILFLVWHKEYPLRAKSCGTGALVAVIVTVTLSVLPYLILIFGSLIAYIIQYIRYI